jgi:hypothetical protein
VTGIIPMNNVAKVTLKAQFNRIGSLVDKFLIVTYIAAADTDVILVEGETRWKRWRI